MFGSRVGFLGTADRMDLLPVGPNPRCARSNQIGHNLKYFLLDDELEGIGATSICSSGVPERQELDSALRLLSTKLSDVRTCGDLVTKHCTALQRALGDLEQLDSQSEAAARIKNVNERATLFRISSSAMINVSISHAVMSATVQLQNF